MDIESLHLLGLIAVSDRHAVMNLRPKTKRNGITRLVKIFIEGTQNLSFGEVITVYVACSEDLKCNTVKHKRDLR